MSIRLPVAVAAALLAGITAAQATTVINGTYTLSNNNTGTYVPTLSDQLSSPFSENLTIGTQSALTTFFQVAPVNGGSGTITGTIAIDLKLTDASGAKVSSFYTSTGGEPATLDGSGGLNLTANYGIFYGNTTDCIAWTTAACTVTGQTTTIGETVTATFTDGEVLAVNLYNWSDWNMEPNISFEVMNGPTAAPEPSSLAVFGFALVGLGVVARRRAWL